MSQRQETGAQYGRDPDANRRVICPDSWAAKSGHPDTNPVTDISASDKASCDEFTFPASYNSGGMPSDMSGTNPVTSGDKCAQTYATTLSDAPDGSTTTSARPRRHGPKYAAGPRCPDGSTPPR
ncbi:hypothetical protein ABZT02_45495 [Streptomyces sp. NPDC005402]|uniref:hypothetical protein n=1 Tax=Streptomyces sp. NPDC005402 TaxID=3155338 RepID=UPI0033B09F98